MKPRRDVAIDARHALSDLVDRTRSELSEPETSQSELKCLAEVLGMLEGAESLLNRSESRYQNYLASMYERSREDGSDAG